MSESASGAVSGAGTLHFRLPGEGWRLADDERTRAAGAAYLAYRSGDDGPFATNLTVTGRTLSDATDLDALADETLADLATRSPDARVVQRRPYGTDAAPGLVQLVAFTVDAGGGPLELQQCQVLLRARNEQAGHDQDVAALLYLIALTGPPDDVRDAAPELQAFLHGVTVEGDG